MINALMKNVLLKEQLLDIEKKERDLYAQKHHASLAEENAKLQCRFLFGKPEVILSIVGLGAYKGASDAKPKVKKNRKTALTTIGRTALLSLFKM